jgi:hypothetical protein
LPLLEREQRHAVRVREGVNRRHERLADGVHQHRRGKRMAAVLPEERGHPARVLQLGHVRVEVQPINALDLQRDVLTQDFGDAPW